MKTILIIKRVVFSLLFGILIGLCIVFAVSLLYSTIATKANAQPNPTAAEWAESDDDDDDYGDDDDDGGYSDDDDDGGNGNGGPINPCPHPPCNPMPLDTYWYVLWIAGSILGGTWYYKNSKKLQ